MREREREREGGREKWQTVVWDRRKCLYSRVVLISGVELHARTVLGEQKVSLLESLLPLILYIM